MQSPSYYSLLGLKPNATTAQVELACKQMLRLYQSSGADPRRLSELEDAHIVLTDPARRAAYDATLKRMGVAAAERGEAAADAGKPLRWLTLLILIMLPLAGTIWWANRPKALPANAGAPVAASSVKAAEAEAPVKPNQDTALLQIKRVERTDLENRLLFVEQQLGSLSQELQQRGDHMDTEEADEMRAKRELLLHEQVWTSERMQVIDQFEMDQAAQGVNLPKQRYPGR